MGYILPLVYLLLSLGLFAGDLISLSNALPHCTVSKCSHHYTHATESRKILKGPSYAFCIVLKSYQDCVHATARNCRGDLEFHSSSLLVNNWMNDYNCSQIIAQGPSEHHVHQHSDVARKHRTRPSVREECVHRGQTGLFSHCGVFGDPHLKTFLNEYQTCRVLGAWPLIDNPYLAVQVTNERVHKESGATATSKVTVIIRDHSPCTTEKTYEAQTDDLPGVFVDGSKSNGNERHVRIKEDEPGKHVEIHIAHIATRIIIRQVSRYLTFAIRMPQEVAMLGSSGESLELCAKGCPKRELIDPSQVLNAPGKREWSSGLYDLESAMGVCRRHNVTDFYFDACVFDLLTTGDDSFSLAAKQAMKDSLHLGPSTARVQGLPVEVNRTFPAEGRKDVRETVSSYNGAGRNKSFPVILLACLVAASGARGLLIGS